MGKVLNMKSLINVLLLSGKLTNDLELCDNVFGPKLFNCLQPRTRLGLQCQSLTSEKVKSALDLQF